MAFNTIKQTGRNKLFLITGLAGYLSILFITLWHKQLPLFDEVLFIPNVYLLEKYGLSKEFLYNIDNQAPGPLYQFIHYPLRHLTHLTTPGIRLVNVFLFGLLIVLLARIFKIIKRVPASQAAAMATTIVAVPMMWQISGLALTEIPTLFFSVFSVLVLIVAMQNEAKRTIKSSALAFIGGILLGLAILGRSPFLLLTVAAFALLINNINNLHRWRTLSIYVITALIITLPVFRIWGGLMPPQQQHVGAGGISAWHGILAFAYGGLLTVIIAPRWFYFNKKILLGIILSYIGFFFINNQFLDYTYQPLSEALRKIFSPAFMKIYPYLVSPLLGVIAFYFVGCSIYRAWQKKNDTIFLFLLLCGMLILASACKVTHLFSTRYVAQAAPFFVLIMIDYDKQSTGKWIRFLAGMIIGILSLETYFLFQ